jgi:hypothetical protein
MDEKYPRGPFLSSATYAMCSTIHTTLQATPEQLVFGRDMVLPIKFIADWGAIEQQRQKEMGPNNRRDNASRISHDYKVGDKILLKKPGNHLRKLEAPTLLIPQVRPAHKYPISLWEMIHLPVGDNALCAPLYTVYPDVCNKSLTATYQC